MKVKILEVATNELILAQIRKGMAKELPSIQQGWMFNFDKNIKKLSQATSYVLVTEETPNIIEGCMIYQTKDDIPQMPYLEIAPHNKGKNKKHDFVAGCLIAYAFKQSLLLEGPYKGMLLFDVKEEDPGNEIKLMALYSKRYGAQRLNQESTTMLIEYEQGTALEERYLNSI